MKIVQALHQLDSHQRQILSHIDAALPLLQLPPDQAQHPLAVARWQMVRMLHAYQIFKHIEIFDPAIRSGSPDHARAATRMKAECIAAGDSFRRHVQQWSATSIADSWDSYRPAMLAMAEELRRHIVRERRSVEMLLDGAERTRRLAG